MTAKELSDFLSTYGDFNVKMRYVDGNKFVDVDVLALNKVKYSDKEIVFYIDK